MSPDHETLIRSSWAEIAPRAQDLTEQFYRSLFELNPASRALFGHTDRTALGRKVFMTLDQIVKVLDEPERLVATLAPLGRHHAGFGVERHHYEAGCTALIIALRTVGGPSFSTEVEQAWRQLYTLVAAVMIRARTGERQARTGEDGRGRARKS